MDGLEWWRQQPWQQQQLQLYLFGENGPFEPEHL